MGDLENKKTLAGDQETAPETPAEPDTPEANVDTPTGEKRFDQADVDRIVQERLNRAEKKWKTTYEAQLEEERKKAAMTETEKLKAEKEEAEKKAQDAMRVANERLLQAEVKAAAVALNIVDPDAAYALMDKDLVEIDEGGTIKDVNKALTALIADKPYLVREKEKQPIGGGSRPAPTDTPTKVYTKAELERMSPDEINKHWGDISEQLQKGLIK